MVFDELTGVWFDPNPKPEEKEDTYEAAECLECKEPFTRKTVFIMGRDFSPRYCGPCIEKAEQKGKEEDARREEEERLARWAAICPPIYRDTDPSDVRLSANGRDAAMRWRPGPKGLGMVGTTGVGKTRCLSLALRAAFDARVSCAFVSHNEFSRTAALAFGGPDDTRKDMMSKLMRWRDVGALLLDDLGKPPKTERADAELEELIEYRTSHRLPILWTANAGGEWLMKRLGEDRGEPLVRRLAEFCEIVTIR